MQVSMKSITASMVVSTLVTFGAGTAAEADLIVSVEAPGVQSSSVSGVTTETFDGFKAGIYSSLVTSVGTVTSMSPGNFVIIPADRYGGAGGTGNYFAVGAQAGSAQPARLLTLGGPQSYFGFWYSAADINNQVSFFSGNQLVGTFNTPLVLAALAKLPDGNKYFGNPNNRGDPGEAFVYLNFTGTSGTTISSVVFANSGSTRSGFESDNWSISAAAPTTIPGTIIPGGVTVTPEPSSMILAGTACLFGGLTYLRRRRGATLAA